MQLVIQVLYFLSSNGLGVVLNDIAHPIMVLIDIVRPLVSLDLDLGGNSRVAPAALQRNSHITTLAIS